MENVASQQIFICAFLSVKHLITQVHDILAHTQVEQECIKLS